MRGDYCDKHRTSEVERCPICECHNLQRQLAEARAEAGRMRKVLEAADSMATSFEEGELGGWEVDLYRRRRSVLQPPTEQPAEAGDHNHNQGN